MDVGRPKVYDYPPFMTPDRGRGGFFVTNPITGKRKRYAAEQEDEARKTALLLAEWVEQVRRQQALDAGRPTIAKLVGLWIEERLPEMPWDVATRQVALWRLERIRRELGMRLVEETDCLALEGWLRGTAVRADGFNKWRYILVLLWRFAVSRKLAAANEAEKIEQRSTSKKIAGNCKQRQPLDVPGYRATHAQAPPWLQLAMDLSLVSLQASKEVRGMRHADFRGGFIYVIRKKVAGTSEMAFIKIAVTAELEALQARARQLPEEARRRPRRRRGNGEEVPVASPFLVHRRPDRLQRRWMAGKPHWTYVSGHYLSQAFAAARDKVPRYAAMKEAERPTFHEIRGLGARLYLARGTDPKAIQALMTHSTPRTTKIYLEGGPEALTDDDYRIVSAPWSLEDLLGPLVTNGTNSNS